MKIFKDGIKSSPALPRSVVTIGNFDGVHLGHRQILKATVEESKKRKITSVVMTFDPHPVKVLYPARRFQQIFDRNDQIEELKKMGVDVLILEPFSRELSQTSPEDFLRNLILRPLSPEKLIVGYDFSFGANKSGGLTQLMDLSNKWGFELEVIPPYKVNGVVVSSSRIRQALNEGDIETANNLLGRTFYIRGIVEKGAGRGTTIGFPTANLFTKAECAPKNGVYAGVASLYNQEFKAVANIGVNPTFTEDEKIKFEIHLLEHNQNIYGEELTFQFLHRLRDEVKFANVESLVKQIKADIEIAKELLKDHA